MEKTIRNKFVCKHCNQVFNHKSTINRHINKIHKPVRHLACPFKNCKYTTARSDVLYRHFVRHTDNKTDKPGNIFKQMNKERGLGEVVTEVSGPVINIPDANIMDTYPPVMSDSQFQSLINNNSVQVTSAPLAPMEFKPESSHQPEQRISITPEIDSDEAFSDIIEGTDYMTILTTSCSENPPSAFVFTPAQQAGMNNSIHTHSTVMDINSHQQMEAKPTVMDINLPQQMEAKVD
jgi:uncharacterized Zn-finger protein